MPKPLILDFDGSVAGLPGAIVIPLQSWQERIRFACTFSTFAALAREIDPQIEPNHWPIFFGSGDFHHITLLLVARLRRLGQQLQVVVFDNHPDNMRLPAGVHCASWVSHVCQLDFVSRVHVIGITSSDVDGLHAFENRLRPLRRGKVTYWCIGKDARLLRLLAGSRNIRSFASARGVLQMAANEIAQSPDPIYLSIDKDVLASDVVQTNWDQGQMSLDELLGAVRTFAPRIIAADVTGEVSSYRYKSRVKRWLSALDRQPIVDEESVARWQRQHEEVNRAILAVVETTV